ncbi:MAG: type II secretion system F family protein [Sedimentisphaerales bacterium]|nr:type II secretion system F family protein [Sedimentisphaerales bacterium]
MAVYEYIAKDGNGNKFSGVCGDIENIAILRNDLAKMGDTLLKAKRRKSQTSKRGRITQDEIVTFTFKLAGMCSAGLSITGCLETLEEQTPNNSFKQILSDIRRNISAGATLKAAFGKHREIFSDFFLGMLEAGQTGGKLSETLEASAVYLEKRLDFRRKIKSAFAYPVIVGFMCFGVIAALVIFVIPVFAKLYRKMHVPLPVPTQILINLSVLVRDFWWAILLVFAAMVLVWKFFRKDRRFKEKWDSFKLNMPILAKFNRIVVATQFIRTFAMMTSAGVPLVKALEVAKEVVNNTKISEITARLQQSIQAGNTVAYSLKDYEIFPPLISQLAASGEEAGKLSEMLNKGADFLDKDIDRMMKAMLVKMEPALTAIMGLVIGFILISVYLPMFDYMSHLE